MPSRKAVIDAVTRALEKHDPAKQIKDRVGLGVAVARFLKSEDQPSVIQELLTITGGDTLEEACQIAAERVTTRPPDAKVYDLRDEQKTAAPKTRVQRGQTVQRDPSQVDGIVIHQTAVPFGVSPRAIKKYGGDREFALAHRALRVACHAMAFQEGFFAVANPLPSYVYHGHSLNARSLGLEIDGRYPGLLDDPETAPDEATQTTWGGDPMRLSDRTCRAARAALAWLVEYGRAQGMPIRYVWAHRQSSPMRRSDPGEAIWRRVVLDYAVPVLGLETQPAEVWHDSGEGAGYPIPVDWDPSGVGRY